MKTFFRNLNSRLVALLAALALAMAQGGAQAQPAYSFSQQELDQMLAPIALYPDALLSQILMASTYPLEVVEAARWSRDRPDLSGDAAVRAAETQNWDASVKSLLAFPQVLARMAENPQWTQALGDAFIDRQSQVMDTVQTLRHKAQAAGNLRSDDRMVVVERGPSLLLQPLDPQIIYVPYYDPLVVYGSWWWPAYPPVYLRPWHGYYARPTYAGGFYWGTPVGISAGFFFAAIDWRQRELRVVPGHHVHHEHLTTARPSNANPPIRAERPYTWRHDPDRRRGLAYRGVETQQRFGAAGVQRARVTQAAPVMQSRPVAPPATQPAAAAHPAPVTQPAPTSQPAPAAQPEPADRRFDRRREIRGAAQQPAIAMKPVPLMQSTPIVQSPPAWRGDRHEARPIASTRLEAPAPQPRAELRPVQIVAHREPAPTPVARHEPAARHGVPQASAPIAAVGPSPAAARPESRPSVVARSKVIP